MCCTVRHDLRKCDGGTMTESACLDFKIDRLPKDLQDTFRELYINGDEQITYLLPDHIHHGDARVLLPQIEPNSIALSV